MKLRLIERRAVWVPTPLGALMLLGAILAPCWAWVSHGESFLSETSRVPADVLVLEAWTHEDGARAAMAEFNAARGQYRYVVAAGGLTGEKWFAKRWSDVEIARRELLRLGLPKTAFIGAQTPDVDTQRTFCTAVAARNALSSRGVRPRGINVLTRGPHARRSRITFSRVFGAQMPVGVIAWLPPGTNTHDWWQSTERASDFLKESVGYVFEAFLDSGRPFRKSPHVGTPRQATRNGRL